MAGRVVMSVLVLLAALYVVLVIGAWRMQERIVWQPPRMAQYPPGYGRRLEYASDDGQPLYAYLIGDPSSTPGLLIAFHGNAELAAWMTSWAREAALRTGWAVLIPEYRGYGGLDGSPSYVSSQQDASATYRLARERLHVDSTRIALYGHSLGSAIATELATSHSPAVLILEAPFTSAREMARGLLAPVALLWRLIARVQFDTRARVATLDVPVWVIHGERDGIIPVRMGRAVHAAARMPGELVLVPGAGHNDVVEVGGDAYWQWLRRALTNTTH
jgi:pimeloyl-ACP methyl ester carboxylesterase